MPKGRPTVNLKQPEWKNCAEVIHESADSRMGMSLCGVPVGRTWTVTAGNVTCRRCKEITKGGEYDKR